MTAPDLPADPTFEARKGRLRRLLPPVTVALLKEAGVPEAEAELMARKSPDDESAAALARLSGASAMDPLDDASVSALIKDKMRPVIIEALFKRRADLIRRRGEACEILQLAILQAMREIAGRITSGELADIGEPAFFSVAARAAVMGSPNPARSAAVALALLADTEEHAHALLVEAWRRREKGEAAADKLGLVRPTGSVRPEGELH